MSHRQRKPDREKDLRLRREDVCSTNWVFAWFHFASLIGRDVEEGLSQPCISGQHVPAAGREGRARTLIEKAQKENFETEILT